MAYRTIAVIVTDAATDRAALAAAAAIALREDAHLDVHCIGVDPARYDAMPAGTAAIVLESGAAEARAQAEDLVAWAGRALPSELVRVAVQSVVVPQLGLDSIVARLSRYSDLDVAPKPYGAGRDALIEAKPLFETWLSAASFVSHGDGKFVIGYSPEQRFFRESLSRYEKDIEDQISAFAASPVRLIIEISADIAPLPTLVIEDEEPEPEAASEAPMEAPEPASAPVSEAPVEDFKKDPLIQEALEVFEARVIKS